MSQQGCSQKKIIAEAMLINVNVHGLIPFLGIKGVFDNKNNHKKAMFEANPLVCLLLATLLVTFKQLAAFHWAKQHNMIWVKFKFNI